MTMDSMALPDSRGLQRVDFATFGREFIHLVLTPQLFANKIGPVLPPSISGETPAVNWGDFTGGKVTYFANNFQVSVGATQTPGQYNVNVRFRIDLTVKFGFSREYIMDVTVPFVLVVQAYAPVVLYVNYVPAQGNQMLINCLSSHTDAIDQQIYPKVEAQLRELVPQQFNQQLANSYKSRVIDITKMQTKAEMALLDAVADSDLAEQVMSTQGQAVQISYEQFGFNFMSGVVTAQMLNAQISQAILTCQNGSNVLAYDGDDGNGHHIKYNGHVTCTPITLDQSTNSYLRFCFNIQVHLDFRVAIGAGWESWIFDLTAPVLMDAECWLGGDAFLFFRIYPVDPNNINFQSQQTSATGFAWPGGDLAHAVPARMAKALNDGFESARTSGATLRDITKQAAQS